MATNLSTTSEKRMAILGFIDDGATITRFVKATPRMHEHVRITFRAVPPTDNSAELKRVDQLSERNKTSEAETAIFQIMADRIKSWEMLDESGNPIPGVPDPVAENIRRVCTPLQNKLMDIVYYQSSGGDHDPFQKSDDTTPAKETVAKQAGN